jgi:electron transport complex protein RnfB
VCESEHTHHIVIPPAQALEIIAQAGKVYVRECPCRARVQACPRDTWEVCLLFEHASEDDLRDTRLITTDEALSILKTTAERGVIYRLFYKPVSFQLTEVCNCCECCCAPLLELKRKGNYGEQLRSGYVAVTDAELCVNCGLCQESCFFDARWLEDGALRFVDERCFGCGRCVEVCPEGAIELELQAERGVPMPSWRGLI